MLVKICGITRQHDASLAYYHGADYLGIIFHPRSPRFCSVESAASLMQLFPDYPWVFVFSYDEDAYIRNILKKFSRIAAKVQLPANHRILHPLAAEVGYENVIPVVHVDNAFSGESLQPLSRFPLLILDVAIRGDDGRKKSPAGGESFSYQLVRHVHRPHLLTGGLNFENLQIAIREAKPFGVDVAGGVEKSPGIKDDAELKKFIRFAKEATRSTSTP